MRMIENKGDLRRFCPSVLSSKSNYFFYYFFAHTIFLSFFFPAPHHPSFTPLSPGHPSVNLPLPHLESEKHCTSILSLSALRLLQEHLLFSFTLQLSLVRLKHHLPDWTGPCQHDTVSFMHHAHRQGYLIKTEYFIISIDSFFFFSRLCVQ